ncbi:MAG TPA: hypothetical protein VFG69_14095 [Nannocystaceae bacterium]|nr:hypothetical protein [Nannocystaceae bacterium]
MNDLGPVAKSVLADYAAVVGPQFPTAAQNWNDLVRRIERGEQPMPLPPATPARGRARLVVAISFAAAAALALVWVGGRVTVAALEADERPSAASWQGGAIVDDQEPAAVVDEVVVVKDDARSRPRSATPTIGAATTVVPPAVAPAPPLVSVRKPKPSVKPPRAPEPTPAITPEDAASALEQVRAIARARAALRDGDPERALRQLDSHARRWPTSDYAEEREMLRVAALCQAGRHDAAKSAAASFRRAHPGSPLGAHLKHCERDEP